FDLILSDVRMPEMDGLAFLRAYRARGGEALVIMMSAYGGEEAALAAMKEGAYDYIAKPFRPDEVVLTLRKAEEREQLGRTIATLKAQLDTTPSARAVVAESPAMRDALELVARVAEHRTTVLITGESGTGKEVIAQAIHRASPRAAAPFVAINCAAIPESLLESELFGHVRGAFTGALADKAGLETQRWPGNVRELEHAIERAAVLSDREVLEPADFRKDPLPAHRSGPQGAGSGTLREAVETAERQAIVAALQAAGGNRRAAAKLLGVSLRTLFYKIDREPLEQCTALPSASILQ